MEEVRRYSLSHGRVLPPKGKCSHAGPCSVVTYLPKTWESGKVRILSSLLQHAEDILLGKNWTSSKHRSTEFIGTSWVLISQEKKKKLQAVKSTAFWQGFDTCQRELGAERKQAICRTASHLSKQSHKCLQGWLDGADIGYQIIVCLPCC